MQLEPVQLELGEAGLAQQLPGLLDALLARTMGDPALLRGQLAHVRYYLALLFDAQPRARTRTSAISVALPSGTSTTQTST